MFSAVTNATSIGASTTHYAYDARGRLTQRCVAMPGDGELAKFQLDHADNRTNYSSTKTDLALYANQGIYSPSGNTALWMQGDSNLVIYSITPSGWVPLWSTNSVGSGANVAYFQSDGNLVLYTPQGTSVWSSATYANPCAAIAVTDAGKVTITNSSGAVVWSVP
jgi:YD repeat-containing protein